MTAPPNSATEQADVVVVGAGPVGLLAANLLGQQGIRCLVLERRASVAEHPRAQTADDETLRSLQAIRLVERFKPLTRPAAGSKYYDANGELFVEVGAGPSNYGHPKRSYILQQQLDRLLYDGLERFDSVAVRFGAEAAAVRSESDRATVSLTDGSEVACRYVLACDGGQSAIRKHLGITMQGWTYAQDWIVLDMVDDPDSEPVSRFYCDPARPAVSICSPGGGRRYEFMLLPGEQADEVLSDDHLATLLADFRPWDASKVTRRAVYTFHARTAAELRQERVFILGDAAHLTPPFAGQGMNAGIRDAHNLAWKLALVCRHGVSDNLLNSYDAERRAPIWSMIQLAVAMGEFVMPLSAEQIALKESVIKALERFPGARQWLFEMRFKPTPRYDDGFFIDLDKQPLSASLVGEMLPQPKVELFDSSLGLLDDVLGEGFTLVVQSDSCADAVTTLTHPIWQQFPVRRIYLHADNAARAKSRHHQSPSSAFDAMACMQAGGDHAADYARPLRTHRDQILLVRPDRYVAGACFAEEFDSFAEKLAKALE